MIERLSRARDKNGSIFSWACRRLGPFMASPRDRQYYIGNLDSITTNQAAIATLLRVANWYARNFFAIIIER